MHELSITENILEIALRHAESNNATRITNLHLVIGQMASIVDDSVQFYWDIIAKDTIAAGARLEFKRIPAEFLCQNCSQRYYPSDDDFSCPNCNCLEVKLVSGDQFFLEAIDIET